MQHVKRFLKSDMRKYSLFIVIIVISVFFHIATNGLIFTPLNLTNIVLQNGYIIILVVGMLPVILSGNIDLSVGSIAAFIGGLAAVLQVNHKYALIPTLLICVLVGAIIGAWQGFWVAIRGIPSFIVTIASQLIFRGLTIVILDGKSIGPFSKSFRAISSSYIPDPFNGERFHYLSLIVGIALCVWVVIRELRQRKNERKYGLQEKPVWTMILNIVVFSLIIMFFSTFFAAYEGLPTILIILAVLIVLYSFITNRTIIGRHLYAIGGNRRAAILSGVKAKKILILTFINIGVMSALAGIVYAARLNAGTPKAGMGFETDAIASCFIGGASVYGGAGTITGAVIGCLIIGIMNNGMSIMGIPVDIQQAIKGLVILFSVAFDMYSKSKRN